MMRSAEFPVKEENILSILIPMSSPLVNKFSGPAAVMNSRLNINSKRRVNGFFQGVWGRAVLIPLLMAVILSLSGCQNTPFQNKADMTGGEKNADASISEQATTSDVPKKARPDATPVEQCQRELVALSKINPGMYENRRVAFTELLKKASVYSSVRQDISQETKETIDALYKYKTQKLCHDIEQDIQQSLMTGGEGLK